MYFKYVINHNFDFKSIYTIDLCNGKKKSVRFSVQVNMFKNYTCTLGWGDFLHEQASYCGNLGMNS